MADFQKIKILFAIILAAINISLFAQKADIQSISEANNSLKKEFEQKAAVSDDFSKLKVTELSYHPKDIIVGTDTTDGKSFEFIEFKNTDSILSINLSGMILDSAVYYIFPENTILAPGEFYVIATKPSYFYEIYGKVPSGNCEDFFANSGEYVLLTDSAGNEILSFTYDDHDPWPEDADGEGYTLTSFEQNPTGNPNDYFYWTASSNINGSPFSDDYQNSDIDPVSYEGGTKNFKVYPNPSSKFIVISANADNSTLSNNSSVKLYSMNGTLIYEDFTGNVSIVDLKGLCLQPGMYILKLESEVGVQTEKLMYQP